MNTTSQTAHGKEATLSSYITVHRKAMGLSLRQLAIRAGVHPSYVCRIESGERVKKPSAAKLQLIADVLNVDVLDLLQFIGVRPRLMRGESVNGTAD
jgi:transcriptional regulator with XRE-family HTH domain